MYNLRQWGQKALSSADLQPFWCTVWRGLGVPFLLPHRAATALPHATLLEVFAGIQWAELVVLGCGLLVLSIWWEQGSAAVYAFSPVVCPALHHFSASEDRPPMVLF
jgi:hypothetical protein